MRVLYCVRLFSGFQSSFQSGEWRPSGVPTIFKVIEALDRGSDELRALFTDRDDGSPFAGAGRSDRPLKGLNTDPRLLGGMMWKRRPVRRLANVCRDLRNLAETWREVLRFRPDIIYVDHANILTAGILARVVRRPIVFRVMGIYPVMRKALTSARPALRLLKWCYRAPFALVVCTQDGSGVETWLDRALDEKVPRRVLLNGLDFDPPTDPVSASLQVPAGRTLVMFLGKLEPDKGVVQFVEAVIAAMRANPGDLHALILGAGSQREEQIRRVAAAGLQDHITFIERLPHHQVAEALRQADIYVSLNRLGNLSNANLEAMCMGCCMIIPRAQPETGVDVVTEEILPADAAVRISSANDIDGLTRAILRLCDSQEDRQTLGANAAAAARRNIPTWTERVNMEIELLREVAEHHGR